MSEADTLKILVPTDFSPGADKALEFAVLLARKTPSKILVLHIYQIPFLPVRGVQFTDTEKGRENFELAEEKLRDLVERMGGLTDIDVETRATPMYGPIEIPEIIKLQSADMIIMGSKKPNTLARWIMGTNAAFVIEHAPCPVLVIPEEADCTHVDRIGLAYDGHAFEDLSRFDFLLRFAKIFDARLDVFHFSSKSQESDAEYAEGLSQLQNFIGRYMDDIYVIEDQTMEEGIQETLEEKQIDILTMLPRSKSILERLVKGSMTKKMVVRVKTGVMVLPVASK